MAEVETLATPADAPAPAPDPASSKKKRPKKRKPIDVTVDASLTGGSAADVAPPVIGRKPIDVTVDASLTGGSAADGAPPVIGYFPTGYDPLAADKPPRARLFRNERHPNRVDLVVRSPAPGGGPNFVGRSYTGEAAAPQLCGYALGVLDKASGTLRVVPIAGHKIMRLEPHLEVQQPAASEAGSAAENDDKKMGFKDATEVFGAKKDKDRDAKWTQFNAQKNDPSAYEDVDLGITKITAGTCDSQEPIRNIPPYDPTADTSEKAYLFDEIIPKNMRPHLLEIVGHLESGEISSKGYGNFVSNRVQKLEELQGEDKERLAWILSYITHLLSLLARNSFMSKRHRKENQATRGPTVPQVVYQKLLLMFTEPGSNALSTEKNELLISYILVLTLFADDFSSDPKDICADLKMTRQMVKPYYDQLGCKAVSTGAFKRSLMTLPVPLKFPKEFRSRRRRR